MSWKTNLFALRAPTELFRTLSRQTYWVRSVPDATTAFCKLEERECTFCKISYLPSCIQSKARTCSLVNVRHRCLNQLDFDESSSQVAFPCQGITFKETLRGLVPKRLLNLRIKIGRRTLGTPFVEMLSRRT